MSQTLGQILTEALHEAGIAGHFMGIEGDEFEVTLLRTVQTSDGGSIALFRDEEFGITGPAVVRQTFNLHTPVR